MKGRIGQAPEGLHANSCVHGRVLTLWCVCGLRGGEAVDFGGLVGEVGKGCGWEMRLGLGLGQATQNHKLEGVSSFMRGV